MIAARDLEIAVGAAWPTIVEALGAALGDFEDRLLPLLRRLDAAREAGEEQACVEAVLQLFASYPPVNERLMDALRAAGAVATKSIGQMAKVVPTQRFARVPVYFGTDRLRLGAAPLAFGGQRGELTCGIAEVSIPDDHRMGSLERPRWWRLEFREDPQLHVVVTSIRELDTEAFVTMARSALVASREPEILLFVHGYHVAFDDALRRAAQIAYDLHFEGLTSVYSWPSEGSLPAYTVDESNILDFSPPNFARFVSLLRERCGAKGLHIMAHSMGNRLLVDLLKTLSAGRDSGGSPFAQVVFAAPDVDAAHFKEAMSSTVPIARRYTLYANSDDLALRASQRVHGYPRAGQSGPDLVVLESVDTVDATAIDTSLMGHSYYGDNRSILSDLFALIRKGSAPNERFGLVEKRRYGKRYWTFAG